MIKFTKVSSEIDILSQHIDFKDKTVVDIGCGTGKISRFLAAKAKLVIGIDTPELICKAVSTEIPENVVFREGLAQNLPLDNCSADILIFFASFHHIPEEKMSAAIKECTRVLKKNGVVCFIEPYAMEGTYYDLTRLLEDEAEIQKTAWQKIAEAGKTQFIQMHESFYYLERSLDYFINQINVYVPDEQKRNEILIKAGELAEEKNIKTGNTVYKSLCRENILMQRDNKITTQNN